MLLEVADTWQKGEPWDIVLRLSFYSLDAEVGMTVSDLKLTARLREMETIGFRHVLRRSRLCAFPGCPD